MFLLSLPSAPLTTRISSTQISMENSQESVLPSSSDSLPSSQILLSLDETYGALLIGAFVGLM